MPLRAIEKRAETEERPSSVWWEVDLRPSRRSQAFATACFHATRSLRAGLAGRPGVGGAAPRRVTRSEPLDQISADTEVTQENGARNNPRGWYACRTPHTNPSRPRRMPSESRAASKPSSRLSEMARIGDGHRFAVGAGALDSSTDRPHMLLLISLISAPSSRATDGAFDYPDNLARTASSTFRPEGSTPKAASAPPSITVSPSTSTFELTVPALLQLHVHVQFTTNPRRHPDGVQAGHSICTIANGNPSHVHPPREKVINGARRAPASNLNRAGPRTLRRAPPMIGHASVQRQSDVQRPMDWPKL